MKKALLTKEQAAALESAKKVHENVGSDYDPATIVAWKVENLFSHDEEALNELSLDTLIRALYVGYEVEPSPHEKIKAFYKENIVKEGPGYHIGVLDGIQQTLNFLNIKIPGVNC